MENNFITGFVTGFADYLSENDIPVTSEEISRFFVVSEGQNIDISNEEQMIELLRSVFCHSRRAYDILPELFRQYISYRRITEFSKNTDNEINELNSQHQAILKSLQETEKTRAERLKELNERRSAAESEIRKKLLEEKLANKPKTSLSAADKKKASKLEKEIKSYKNNLITECLLEEKEGSWSISDIDAAEKSLAEEVKKALQKKNLTKISSIRDIQTLLHKIRTTKEKENSSTEKIKFESEVSKQLENFDKEKTEIEAEYKKTKNLQNSIRQKIANDLNKQKNIQKSAKLTCKNQSVIHREFFIGRGSVQALYSEPECIMKSFKTLTETEKTSIRNYILSNLLRFKTKMTRSIVTLERDRIDMQTTIQYACKTGGLPMNLYFQQKRPSKTNLMLILDVSGSCKEASEMMLTFMYYLQTVFPRGTKAYAFVNSLYDISEIMNANDPDTAVSAALSLIPRNGVYSNYAVPLRQIWDEHKKEITKDTLIIFMGDARNNQNPKSEEELKNICRKAKKAFWLNTEISEKWGKNDSVAYEYSRYAKMYETTNLRDLLWFIQEGVR